MNGESAKILMTGSDLVGISSYAKLLQMQGHQAFTAFSGADLLDLLSKKNFEFDLIITDVRIPGLSSYELGDYIAMNSGADIPVIGIAEFPRDEELMMQAGESFAMVIEKGFTAQELIDAVNSILSSRDHTLSEGMSEQQIRSRAAQLSDTKTVVMNRDSYVDMARNLVQNRGHQSLIEKLREK